jgi:hypothetical protein
MEAADRQRQRGAQKQLRELERRRKEQAKLSAIEQARLEVESYENQLEVLSSVHKDQGQIWDWAAVAASLPPPPPQRQSRNELRARQNALMLSVNERASGAEEIKQAQALDDQTFQQASELQGRECAEWEKLKALAVRILAGDPKAFTDALVELSPLGEISDLGSALHFTVHDAHLLECTLKANGVQAIPAEIKTLTASNKLSAKPMPKARFHELYQDYICSCILRVAREVFALLPIDTLLITASADTADPRTGQTVEQAVLSAAMTREATALLDFEHLDPSTALDNYLHRGDFKATRKTGAFAPISPLTPADIDGRSLTRPSYADLLAAVRRLRVDLKADVATLLPRPTATTT